MLKQSQFLVHRGDYIPAASVIICGNCEMPIWRMTASLDGLRKHHTGYQGIPRQFIRLLDGSPPKRQRHFNRIYWHCPECGDYLVSNEAVFFEMHPCHWTSRDGIGHEPSIGHRLRFFIDYEGG